MGDERGQQRERIQDISGPLQERLVNQGTEFQNRYSGAADMNTQNYMDLFRGFQDFQKTGGFTPEGLSAIRSRAIAPSRAIYENAMRNINRQTSLQGGYNPGKTAALSRLQRDTGQAMSDSSVNAEALIADMVQRGRLGGLQGATNLYGTTPGLTNMFGNQLLQNMGQQTNLGTSLIDDYFNAAQLPGKWGSTFGRIGDVLGLASRFINPLGGSIPGGGAPGGGGGSPDGLPYSYPFNSSQEGVIEGGENINDILDRLGQGGDTRPPGRK